MCELLGLHSLAFGHVSFFHHLEYSTEHGKYIMIKLKR
jgi:hypothetical protein